MINIYCMSCHSPFAKAESRHELEPAIGKTYKCPTCGKDYLTEFGQLVYQDENGFVYTAEYKHDLPETPKEPKAKIVPAPKKEPVKPKKGWLGKGK